MTDKSGPFSILSDTISILRDAIKAVPSVRYAYGVAGVAAATAIVALLLSQSATTYLALAIVFAGMILLLVFSSLVKSNSVSTRIAGQVLLWAVTIFFIVFIALCLFLFVATLSRDRICDALTNVGMANYCSVSADDECPDMSGMWHSDENNVTVPIRWSKERGVCEIESKFNVGEDHFEANGRWDHSLRGYAVDVVKTRGTCRAPYSVFVQIVRRNTYRSSETLPANSCGFGPDPSQVLFYERISDAPAQTAQ